MAIAICSECGSPVEIADGEEWGYCPMCDNDQVELKRKTKCNQSLTGTYEVKYDYDEDDDGETVEQVIVDNKKYIDIEYFARIKADLEKALELACEDRKMQICKKCIDYQNVSGIKLSCQLCSYTTESNIQQYFKQQAKEMMKSE